MYICIYVIRYRVWPPVITWHLTLPEVFFADGFLGKSIEVFMEGFPTPIFDESHPPVINYQYEKM